MLKLYGEPPSQLVSNSALLSHNNFLYKDSISLDCMTQQTIVNVCTFRTSLKNGMWLRSVPIRQTWSLGGHLLLVLNKNLDGR